MKATTFVPPRRLCVVSRVACIQPCSPTASSCVSWSRSDVADPATQAIEARRGVKAAIPLPRSVCSAGSRMTEPASETPGVVALWARSGACRVKSSDTGRRFIHQRFSPLAADLHSRRCELRIIVSSKQSSKVLGLFRCLFRRPRPSPRTLARIQDHTIYAFFESVLSCLSCRDFCVPNVFFWTIGGRNRTPTCI